MAPKIIAKVAITCICLLVLGIGVLPIMNNGSQNTITQIQPYTDFAIAQDSEWLFVDDWDESNGTWTESGADPWLGDNTDYISVVSDELTEGWFSFPDTTLTGTITANISIYAKNDDGAGNDHIEVWIDYVARAGVDMGDMNCDTSYAWFTFSIGDLTAAQVNAIRVHFISDMITQPDGLYIERVKIGLYSAGGGETYEVIINEIITLYDSVDTTVNLSLHVNEIITLYDSVDTIVNLSLIITEIIGLDDNVSFIISGFYTIIINEIIGVADTITTALNASLTLYEIIEIFESVTVVMNPISIITLIINEIITIGSNETITGGLEGLNIFYDLFLSNNMWSYFGPLALVVIGYIVAKKEKPLGIFMIIVESLILWHYFTLVSATPEYWWHIIILLMGVIICAFQSLSR